MQAIDLTKVTGPTEKVEENEVVVGKLSDDLKRLYHIFVQAGDAYKAVLKTIDEKTEAHHKLHFDGVAHSREDCLRHEAEITLMLADAEPYRVVYENIGQIFTLIISHDFPGLTGGSVCRVREDYNLVITLGF